MPFGTDPILGPQGAGMVGADGTLTDAARTKFVADILAIVTVGNEDGKGIMATGFLPLPIFPTPGPKVIIDPILHPEGENLFWFKKEPLALLAAPILADKTKQFQTIIVDELYAPLVKMLNLNGATPLFPIFDPTTVVDLSKFPNLQLPDIPQILIKLTVAFALAAVPLTLPKAQLSFSDDFGISGANIKALIALLVPPVPPSLPVAVPTIPVPAIPLPNGPGVSVPNFPDLALGFFKMPLALLPQLLTLVTSPTISPPDLLLKIIGLIVDILLGILQALGLLTGLPKLMLAMLMVMVKNLAVMLLCVVIGKVLGTGGLVKIVATIGGVV